MAPGYPVFLVLGLTVVLGGFGQYDQIRESLRLARSPSRNSPNEDGHYFAIDLGKEKFASLPPITAHPCPIRRRWGSTSPTRDREIALGGEKSLTEQGRLEYSVAESGGLRSPFPFTFLGIPILRRQQVSSPDYNEYYPIRPWLQIPVSLRQTLHDLSTQPFRRSFQSPVGF